MVARPAWADGCALAGPRRAWTSPDIAGDLRLIGRVAGRRPGVVLAAADIVAHRAALAQFARSGARTDAAVATGRGQSAEGGAYPQPIMRERDLVISVGTAVPPR